MNSRDRMSIIGRPNVGKSSLLNAICGEKRAIVSDISGTTTDSIDTLIEKDSHLWKIVDTCLLYTSPSPRD